MFLIFRIFIFLITSVKHNIMIYIVAWHMTFILYRYIIINTLLLLSRHIAFAVFYRFYDVIKIYTHTFIIYYIIIVVPRAFPIERIRRRPEDSFHIPIYWILRTHFTSQSTNNPLSNVYLSIRKMCDKKKQPKVYLMSCKDCKTFTVRNQAEIDII